MIIVMGSAAAIFAGKELGDRVQGYILESPYQDLETAVWNRTEAYLPPVLDRFAYLGLGMTVPWVLPDFKAIAPVRAIEGIPEPVPILILSGTDDQLATPAEAQALFDRVKTHARIELIQGGEHHGLIEVNPQRYGDLLIGFSTSALRTGRTPSPRN